MSESTNASCNMSLVHAAFVVYTFIVWGFWWGVLSIIFPIFPIIDIVKYLITLAPWLQ